MNHSPAFAAHTKHSAAQRRRALLQQDVFVGSVVELKPDGTPLLEVSYYWRAGQAFGYLGQRSRRICCRQWSVATIGQLREWVQLEQLATGLRRAVARQTIPVDVTCVPTALLRLRVAASQAVARADAAEASPRRIALW